MPTPDTNPLGLKIGFEVQNWSRPSLPSDTILKGQYCRCEPLSIEKHSTQLFEANRLDADDRLWVYMPYGPFETLAQYQNWMDETCFKGDPFFYAIIDENTQKAIGVASYLRIDPTNGSIEVGHINYSPALQNTTAATEAMYLMMNNAFELGYRRYEWKCNSLNERSCRAAIRLGFSYEGIFRQATVTKGRNRDTTWFAMIDLEWPALKRAFLQWLNTDNFTPNGEQKRPLSSMTRDALVHAHAPVNTEADTGATTNDNH